MKHFVLLFCLIFAGTTHANSIVLGYYMAWERTTIPVESIPLQNLTHLAHAFAWPEADGRLSMYDNLIYPQLVERVHKAGVKIILSLGGWGNCSGFSPMAANPQARERFVQNLVDFCSRNHYDGVDIDWEFPQNKTDRSNLSLFVSELREAFNNNNASWLITMAISAGDWSGQWFDYKALGMNVNWFGCMTYDFHGSWSDHAGHNSPLYAPATDPDGSVDTAVRYLTSTRGIDKAMILIGLAFYGKQFQAARLYGASSGCTDVNYNEIVPKINNGWSYIWDDVSKVPYLVNSTRTSLISFDDSLSLRLKCEYAQDKNLGGVMIWALGQDRAGEAQPLLSAVGRSMGLPTDTYPPFQEIPDSFVLLNNYPNPFNGSTTIPYFVSTLQKIRIDVFDVAGRQAATVVDGVQSIGWHEARFFSQGFPSGIYFYRLSSFNFSATRKLTIIR
jgi:chitinase